MTTGRRFRVTDVRSKVCLNDSTAAARPAGRARAGALLAGIGGER